MNNVSPRGVHRQMNKRNVLSSHLFIIHGINPWNKYRFQTKYSRTTSAEKDTSLGKYENELNARMLTYIWHKECDTHLSHRQNPTEKGLTFTNNILRFSHDFVIISSLTFKVTLGPCHWSKYGSQAQVKLSFHKTRRIAVYRSHV